MANNVFAHTVIRASAGSGKTYRLSARFLQLLLAGVPVDSILATTFTRTAAFEIQSRILERLAKGALSDEGAQALSAQLSSEEHEYKVSRERLRDLTVEITRSIDRLRVSTLDAFFMRIATGFQFEIGMPPAWSIADETDNEALLQRALQATFAQTDARGAHEFAKRLFKGESKRNVESQILAIADKSLEIFRESSAEAWNDLTRYIPDSDELDTCVEKLMAAELPRNAPKGKNQDKSNAPFNGNFVSDREKLVKLLQNDDWKGALKTGLVGRVCDGSLIHRSRQIEGDLLEALQRIIRYVKAQQLAKMANALTARYALLREVDRFYNRFKRDKGAYRFDDVAEILSKLQLKDQLQRIVYRLDAKTSHLLLDEFQDSSPTQWAIIRPFAESITQRRSDDLNLNDPNDVAKLTSFFCVGDVKQAIYGWRGGVAEIFQEIEDTLPNLKKEGMEINWRSCPAIIDVVNEIFHNLTANSLWNDGVPNSEAEDKQMKRDAVLRAVEKWQRQFQDHVVSKPNQEKKGYWALEVAPRCDELNEKPDDEKFAPIYRCNHEDQPRILERDVNDAPPIFDADELNDDEEEGEDENSANEESVGKRQKATTLEYVVQRIAQLNKQYPEYSIGVLVRSRNYLNQVIRGLKRKGIEASTEGGVPIVDTASTLAALSLIKLAAHPEDTVAAFHVANVAPLAERYNLSTRNYREAAGRVSSYLREQIETFGLGKFASDARALLNSLYVDSRNRERLDKFVEYAFTYEENEPLATLDQFINAVKQARAESPSAKNIRVMTIHLSKGLEFDIVVLPELDVSSSIVDLVRLNYSDLYAGHELKRNPETGALERSSLTPIQRVVGYANKEVRQILPEEYKTIFAYEQEKHMEEALCLLYVAITRPVRMLVAIINPVLPNSSSKKKDKQQDAATETDPLQAPSSQLLSFANILRRALGGSNEKCDPSSRYFKNAQVIYENGDPNWADDDRKQTATKQATQEKKSDAIIAPTILRTREKRLLFKRETPTGGRDTLQWVPESAYKRGTALHACFELVDWLDLDGIPDDEQIERILFPLLMNRAEVDKTSREFKRMCQTPYVQALLSRASYEQPDARQNGPRAAVQLDAPNPRASWRVYRERPFSARRGETLWRGVIDRLTLLYDGDKVVAADVVDYKTNQFHVEDHRRADDPTLVPQETLDEYRRQLAYYGKVVQEQYQLPEDRVSLRLAFVSHNFTIDAKS